MLKLSVEEESALKAICCFRALSKYIVQILIQPPGFMSHEKGDGGRKRRTVMYVTQHHTLVSDNQSLITVWINDEDPVSFSSSRTGLM